jgi:hypothetical protein
MNKKQELGQFMTTNYKYIMQNMYIPEQINIIIEPFVGNGDLLKWWQIFGDGRDISITSLYNNYRVCL